MKIKEVYYKLKYKFLLKENDANGCFKPRIGIFVSSIGELNELLSKHPYDKSKILSVRNKLRPINIEFEHFDLVIFYGLNQGIRGYRFSNIIMSDTVKLKLDNNKDKYLIEGILGNNMNPFGYFGASINIVNI